MKRRHLVVLISAFTLVTMIFVVAVTIGVGVGTDPGREQIRALIQQQVGSRVRGKVHLGKIHGGLLTGFTIDSFAIRDYEDSVLVSTGKVSLDYDPRDLLDRRLLLRNVRVEHPVFRLWQHQKGDWNFQRILKKGQQSTPDVPGRSFGDFVVLDSVHVHDAQFILTRPWEPDDTLTGAKRDSAIRVNLANPRREIRRSSEGFTHTHRWSGATAFLPHIRIADPDSNSFGQEFVIESMRVEEQEPPFSFRSARGVVRKMGDSVFVNMAHFDLPASAGSATAKVWWGSNLPVRLDIRITADSVSLKDVAWVYPTLPTEGGGRTKLQITNNKQNLHIFEYALSDMDVRSTKSRLTGAMTFVVGGPVLAVRDVDLQGAPINFDLVRTLAGAPFPVDWQGNLYGFAQGPGGPLTHFMLDRSDVTWHDTHVPGAVSRLSGRGELDILDPAFTRFHGFDVDVSTLDLRSIEYLFPGFPRIHGTVAGTATLDSVWTDVRFSKANVTHRNGPGDPTRVTGAGRVTYGKEFMKFDVAVNAEPLSLTMMSNAYPLGLKGLLSGPIQVKGISNDLQLAMDLQGPAGRISYNGKVDAYPLSVAARGSGRVEGLDLSQLLAQIKTPPGWITGAYQLDVRGDTNDLATLQGSAAMQLDRSEFDSIRVFPSRFRARFADGRMYIDTLRIESVAAAITASGALGLASRASDTLHYQVVVDSLGGLRRYITKFTSSWAQQPAVASAASADSLAGSMVLLGSVRGSVKALDVSGQVVGKNIFVRREAGKEIVGSFALANVLAQPSGTASLRFNALDVGGIVLDTLGGAVQFEAGRTGVFSFGSLAKNGVTLAAHGDLALSDSTTTVVVRDIALVTDSSRWSLRGPSNIETKGRGISIDSLILVNGAGGRISLEGTVPDTGRARIFLRADSVSLHDVGRVVQLRAPFSGWAHVTAQGAGPALAPVMNMQAALSDVRYGGVQLQGVNATAEYINKRATVALDLSRNGHKALAARGSLPLELKYFGARLLDDSLHGTIRTDSASFDIIEALVPGLKEATGRLVMNLDVAGTWKHPDLAGVLRVENGEVYVDTLGIRLKGVNVDVAVFGHNDSLAIRRFVASTQTGPADSISLKGYVAYREINSPYVDLTLAARSFRALDKRSLARMDISTEPGGLRLRGRLRGATLRGGLVVDRGTIFLPDPELARKQVTEVGASFRDTSAAARQLRPEKSSHFFDSILIDGVRITLGDDVWLRSREANIKLGGSLSVQRSTRQSEELAQETGMGSRGERDGGSVPALDGVLRAERGTYTLALGIVLREFQVQEGTITFYPTPELKPELNITALHTVHTANGEDLHIRVRLTGPLYPNPIISLESAESFPMSTSEMVSYLIFGQPDFQLGSADKGAVQLAAQTLFPSLQTFGASQLRNVLGSWADVLQVRFGSTDLTALSGGRSSTTQGEALRQILWNSRLGAEKQLTDRVFVSLSTGICQLSQSNSQPGTTSQLEDFYNGLSGKFEYRLSRDASIKAGKEPSQSQMICGGRSTTGRLVSAPSQWGFSLFKSWRF
jgi:translocation and assembly module TamB